LLFGNIYIYIYIMRFQIAIFLKHNSQTIHFMWFGLKSHFLFMNRNSKCTINMVVELITKQNTYKVLRKSLVFKLASEREVFRSNGQLWCTIESLPKSSIILPFYFRSNGYLIKCLVRFRFTSVQMRVS
jgi:hypothetical protein